MLKKLLAIRSEKKYRRTLNRIRASLASFGIDTSHLTDQELEDQVLAMCQSMARIFDSSTLPAGQAAAAFSALAQGLQGPKTG